MIFLSTTDLTLRFGTTSVLEKVSFSVDERDKLGVIGVNGSGKSSLFKLLTGEYEPTEGEVYLSKGKTMGILTQDGAFDEDGEDGTGEESALQHMVHAFPQLLRAEAELVEATGTATVGGGWRRLPNYYAMRDCLHVPYMN